METIGMRLKALRKKEGVTQDELAKAIGVTFGQISAVEIGRTAPDEVISLICKHYKVSKEWFINGAGDSPKGVVVPIRKELNESPWKDATYQQMREEIEFLRNVVKQLTAGKAATANFHDASIEVGSHIGRHNSLELPFPTGEQIGARA